MPDAGQTSNAVSCKADKSSTSTFLGQVFSDPLWFVSEQATTHASQRQGETNATAKTQSSSDPTKGASALLKYNSIQGNIAELRNFIQTLQSLQTPIEATTARGRHLSRWRKKEREQPAKTSPSLSEWTGSVSDLAEAALDSYGKVIKTGLSPDGIESENIRGLVLEAFRAYGSYLSTVRTRSIRSREDLQAVSRLTIAACVEEFTETVSVDPSQAEQWERAVTRVANITQCLSHLLDNSLDVAAAAGALEMEGLVEEGTNIVLDLCKNLSPLEVR